MWKMVLTSSLEIFVMPTSRFAAFCYLQAMLPDAASPSWGCFPQAAEEEDFHDLVARLTAQYDQQQAHCTELEDENAVLRQALSAASTTGPTGPTGPVDSVDPTPAPRVSETSRWEVVGGTK
jgi:hypothetical protein